MGRKPGRTGKYIYICIAGVIFFSPSGCALVKEIKNRQEARELMLQGRKLLAQGDYEGSLKENQRVLSLSPDGSPADEAVFNMGLVYAHAGNPKRDYRKAVGLFRKLTKEYPRSPWAEQAKIWVGMLEEDERLTQALKRLQEERERSSQLLRKLKEENERLNEVFRKLKEVDIEIEEKKREKAR